MKKSTFVFASMLFALIAFGQRQRDKIEHIWWNQEKDSKIQIYLATDGKYYGKIIWMEKPNDEKTGKPRLDKENPNDARKSDPVMGLVFLKGFSIDAEDKNLYTGGSIYDPKNGKTYCGKITFKGKSLDLRGFICSVPFLGRTANWELAE
jgi:uncharacterized protein (DUF2147 family)